ncbi:MAG: metalloprotease [Flavobacteriaceae bacterium]|nr:MAG: metalloprotease [Flavobacteriaceae bacterium]
MKAGVINILIGFIVFSAFGQNSMKIDAKLDAESKQISIHQEITYSNRTSDSLHTIYLNDWNNSYSTKTTPLAMRFAEEFDSKFHFAKNEDRGFTIVTGVKSETGNSLKYSRLWDHPDVLKIYLEEPLNKNESYTIELDYTIQVPSDKFSRYGKNNLDDYELRYWYITPAVYDGEWQYYSNKNLDDMFIPSSNLELKINVPRNYVVNSELDNAGLEQFESTQTFTLIGQNRIDTKLSITKLPIYKFVQTDHFSILSNIDDENLAPLAKALVNDNVAKFIVDNLGDYPHDKLFLTEIEYRNDPIYGLNLLPNFIKPYPARFEYELKLLKTALNNYLTNTLLLNPRKEQWLLDGLQTYYLIKYVEEYYPDMKILGKFAKVWGIRSFYAAKLDFNDQYDFLYQSMARTNLDQPLGMQKDSLLKFNKNIANKYKAGIGLKYLGQFVDQDVLERTIKDYIAQYRLKETSVKDFETMMRKATEKDIDWFFGDYVQTRKKNDFKIRNLKKTEDSVTFTIRNRRNSNMPVSVFKLKDDSIISKTWVTDLRGEKTITLARDSATKLVLNYDKVIPEHNLRNNWKSLKGFFFNNKPLQLRLFKDVQNPDYNQLFFMPLVEYNNIYDGVTLGMKVYNRTALRKPFDYRIQPKYSLNSNSLTGSATFSYNKYIENRDLYRIYYGIGGKYSSYAENLFVRVITPTISFNFRDDNDFRSNKNSRLNFRYLDISRDPDINNISDNEDPAYSVFNIRYLNSNRELLNVSQWFADFQLSKDFGKISFNYTYRKLFNNNRQLDLRFFAGSFLYNNTEADNDFFSFALDRPTDYLFDYNYLGRSETSGIFSQQIIIAEGGFKSKLETPFANQWISTINGSTSIWQYIHAYGDIGLVKNKGNNVKVVYDTGIRLSLVQDYFELYFPVYSKLGWEIAQPNYDQKIRFQITLDPQTLLGLFRRKWF